MAVITNPDSYSTPYLTPLVVGYADSYQVPDDENVGQFDLISTSGSAQTDVPVTHGFYFSEGQVPDGKQLVVRQTSDGTVFHTGTQVQNRHADDSIKFAVVTFMRPTLSAGVTVGHTLDTTDDNAGGSAITVPSITATAYDCTVTVTIGGTAYSASADTLLTALEAYNLWLYEGTRVHMEIRVHGPLKTSGGTAHPHLYAFFSVRKYKDGSIFTRVTVENCRYLKDAQNSGGFSSATFQDYIGNIAITVQGSGTVFSQSNFRHVRQTRWTKTFWWGRSEPLYGVRLGSAIIDRMKAAAIIPNYKAVTVPGSAFTDYETLWDKRSGLGSCGLAEPEMTQTGARGDIGVLPRWDAMYLNTWNADGFKHIVGTSELAGNWHIHVRAAAGGSPYVSIDSYPYICGDWVESGEESGSANPNTGNNEYLPATASGGIWQPHIITDVAPYFDNEVTQYAPDDDLDEYRMTPDSSHLPRFSYLAYLLTGDQYHHDELQFWANWNLIKINPEYRNYDDGELQSNQARGYAWSLITLAYAYNTALDGTGPKTYFGAKLENNRLRLLKDFVDNPCKSPLGLITTGNGVFDDSGDNVVRPWMHHFFGHVIGEIDDMLPDTGWRAIRWWQTKLATHAVTDPDFCPKGAGIYTYMISNTGSWDETTWPTNFKTLLALTEPSWVGACPSTYQGNVNLAESYTAQIMANLASAAALRAPAETWRANHDAALLAASAPVDSQPTFYVNSRSTASANALESLTPGRWYQWAGNKLTDVGPSVSNNGLAAISGSMQTAIAGTDGTRGCMAYSGAAYDRLNDQLLVWGGGHGNYYGNEVYAMDIRSGNFKRLTNPGPSGWSSGYSYSNIETLSDGTPNTRHTYNCLVYVAEKNALYSMGGGVVSGNGSAGSGRVWKFSLATNTWTNLCALPSDDGIFSAVYDPKTRRIFVRDLVKLRAFNIDSNSFDWASNENGDDEYMYYTGMDIDITRRLIVMFGWVDPAGISRHYDLSSWSQGSSSSVTVTNPSYTDSTGLALQNEANGSLCYNPRLKKFVIYKTGTSVHLLDPVAHTVTTRAADGGNTVTPTVGGAGFDYDVYFFRRFGYIPTHDIHYLVTRGDIKPYFIRLAN